MIQQMKGKKKEESEKNDCGFFLFSYFSVTRGFVTRRTRGGLQNAGSAERGMLIGGAECRMQGRGKRGNTAGCVLLLFFYSSVTTEFRK